MSPYKEYYKFICRNLKSDDFKNNLTQPVFLFGTGDLRIDNMFLIIKSYIYTTRKHKKEFKFVDFLKEINMRIYSDKTHLSAERFRKKWHGLEYLLDNLNIPSDGNSKIDFN